MSFCECVSTRDVIKSSFTDQPNGECFICRNCGKNLSNENAQKIFKKQVQMAFKKFQEENSPTVEGIESYKEFLVANGYENIKFYNDGKSWAATLPFLFTTAIIIGRVGDRAGYDDRWCYKNTFRALFASDEWEKNDFKGEPVGWHRHPGTGRRRKDGDPALETIEL